MSVPDGKANTANAGNGGSSQNSQSGSSNATAGPNNRNSRTDLSPDSHLSELPSDSLGSILQDDDDFSAIFRSSAETRNFPFERHSKGAPRVFKGDYRDVKQWLMKADILFKQSHFPSKYCCEFVLNWASADVQTIIKGCTSYKQGDWEGLKNEILDLWDYEKNDQQFQEDDLDVIRRYYNEQQLNTLDGWKSYKRNITAVGGWLHNKNKITEHKWREVFWFSIPKSARKKLIPVLEQTVNPNPEELWTPSEVDAAAKQLWRRGRVDKKGLEDSEDEDDLEDIAGFIRKIRRKPRKRSKKTDRKRKSRKTDVDETDSDSSDDETDTDSEDDVTVWKTRRKSTVRFKDIGKDKEKVRGREEMRKDRLKRYFSPESSRERDAKQSSKKEGFNLEEIIDGMGNMDLNKEDDAKKFYMNYYMLKLNAPQIETYLDRIRANKEREIRTMNITTAPTQAPLTSSILPPTGMGRGAYPLPTQSQAYAGARSASPGFGNSRASTAECFACNGTGHQSSGCPTMRNLFDNGIVIRNGNGRWAWTDGNEIRYRRGESLIQAMERTEPGSTRPQTKVGICMIDPQEEGYYSEEEPDFDEENDYGMLIDTLTGRYDELERERNRYPVYLGVDRSARDTRSSRRTAYERTPVPTRTGKPAERPSRYNNNREGESSSTRQTKENTPAPQEPVDAVRTSRFNPLDDDAIMADHSTTPPKRPGPPGIRANELAAWESRTGAGKSSPAASKIGSRVETSRSPATNNKLPPQKTILQRSAEAEAETMRELSPRMDEAHKFVDKMMRTELPMTIEQIVRLSNRDVTQALTSRIKPPRSSAKADVRVNYTYPEEREQMDHEEMRTFKTQIDEASRGSLIALRMKYRDQKVEAIIDTGSMISIMSREYYEEYFSDAAIETSVNARLHDANGGTRPFSGLLLNVELSCGGAMTMTHIYVVENRYKNGLDGNTYDREPNFHLILGIKWMEKNHVSIMMVDGKRYAQFAFPLLQKTVQVPLIKPTELRTLRRGARIENINPEEEENEGYMMRISNEEVIDSDDDSYMVRIRVDGPENVGLYEDATDQSVRDRESRATSSTSLVSRLHPSGVTRRTPSATSLHTIVAPSASSSSVSSLLPGHLSSLEPTVPTPAEADTTVPGAALPERAVVRTSPIGWVEALQNGTRSINPSWLEYADGNRTRARAFLAKRTSSVSSSSTLSSTSDENITSARPANRDLDTVTDEGEGLVAQHTSAVSETCAPAAAEERGESGRYEGTPNDVSVTRVATNNMGLDREGSTYHDYPFAASQTQNSGTGAPARTLGSNELEVRPTRSYSDSPIPNRPATNDRFPPRPGPYTIQRSQTPPKVENRLFPFLEDLIRPAEPEYRRITRPTTTPMAPYEGVRIFANLPQRAKRQARAMIQDVAPLNTRGLTCAQCGETCHESYCPGTESRTLDVVTPAPSSSHPSWLDQPARTDNTEHPVSVSDVRLDLLNGAYEMPLNMPASSSANDTGSAAAPLPGQQHGFRPEHDLGRAPEAIEREGSSAEDADRTNEDLERPAYSDARYYRDSRVRSRNSSGTKRIRASPLLPPHPLMRAYLDRSVISPPQVSQEQADFKKLVAYEESPSPDEIEQQSRTVGTLLPAEHTDKRPDHGSSSQQTTTAADPRVAENPAKLTRGATAPSALFTEQSTNPAEYKSCAAQPAGKLPTPIFADRRREVGTSAISNTVIAVRTSAPTLSNDHADTSVSDRVTPDVRSRLMQNLEFHTTWGVPDEDDDSATGPDGVYARRHAPSHWVGSLIPAEFGRTRREYLGKLFGDIPFEQVDVQKFETFPETAKVTIRKITSIAWYSIRVVNTDGEVLYEDKPGPRPFVIGPKGASAMRARARARRLLWAEVTDAALWQKRLDVQTQHFKWLICADTAEPMPTKPDEHLISIFDPLHAGFSGSIDNPVLHSRMLSTEPIISYDMGWAARRGATLTGSGQKRAEDCEPSLLDIFSGWEEDTDHTLHKNQYLPPYARGFSAIVRARATPSLPIRELIIPSTTDELEYQENRRLGIEADGAPEDASYDEDIPSEYWGSEGCEPAPSPPMTNDELTARLEYIMTNSTPAEELEQREGFSADELSDEAVLTRARPASEQSGILEVEAGAQLDDTSAAVRWQTPPNTAGLPLGEWFYSCGHPRRLIHDIADARPVSESVPAQGHPPNFDTPRERLEIAAIRERATMVGSTFASANERTLLAMRFAVQVRKYLWLMTEPMRVAGFDAGLELPDDGLDYIFDLEHAYLTSAVPDRPTVSPLTPSGLLTQYPHDAEMPVLFRGFELGVHVCASRFIEEANVSGWLTDAFHHNSLRAVGLEEDLRLRHIAEDAINWLICVLRSQERRSVPIEEDIPILNDTAVSRTSTTISIRQNAEVETAPEVPFETQGARIIPVTDPIELARNRQEVAARAIELARDLGPDDLLLRSRDIAYYHWHAPSNSETHHVFEISDADVIRGEVHDDEDYINGRGRSFRGTAYLVLIETYDGSDFSSVTPPATPDSAPFLDVPFEQSVPERGVEAPSPVADRMSSPATTHISDSESEYFTGSDGMPRGRTQQIISGRPPRTVNMAAPSVVRARVAEAAGTLAPGTRREIAENEGVTAARSARGITDSNARENSLRGQQSSPALTSVDDREFPYKYESLYRAQTVTIRIGQTIRPSDLQRILHNEARRILSALRIYRDSTKLQDSPVVNGIIHGNESVEQIHGTPREHMVVFMFVYRVLKCVLEESVQPVNDHSPVERLLAERECHILARGHKYPLTIALCEPSTHDNNLAFHVSVPPDLGYSNLAACTVSRTTPNAPAVVPTDVRMASPKPMRVQDPEYEAFLARSGSPVDGTPAASEYLDYDVDDSDEDVSEATSATTSEQNERYLRSLLVSVDSPRLEPAQLPTPPYSPVTPATPPYSPVLLGNSLAPAVFTNSEPAAPYVGTVSLPTVTTTSLEEVRDAEKELMRRAKVPELTAESLEDLACAIIPGFKTSNRRLEREEVHNAYTRTMRWVFRNSLEIVRSEHEGAAGKQEGPQAKTLLDELQLVRDDIKTQQESIDWLMYAVDELNGHVGVEDFPRLDTPMPTPSRSPVVSAAPSALHGQTSPTPSVGALTDLREPAPSPVWPSLVTQIAPAMPKPTILVNGQPPAKFKPAFVFPAVTTPVIPGSYVADEPSKASALEGLSQQLDDLTETVDLFVDETITHHCEQLENAVEQAQSTISTEIIDARDNLHEEFERIGEHILGAMRENHADAMDDIAHVGHHVVNTQQGVAELQERLLDNTTITTAGFIGMGADNKSRDEAMKARLGFTIETADKLIRLQTFLVDRMEGFEQRIGEHLDRQLAFICKQQDEVDVRFQGHARRVLAGYDRIVKRQDELFERTHNMLEERFGPPGRQREQSDDILTRTYHDVHKARLDLAALANEIFTHFQELHDYGSGMLHLFLYTAYCLFRVAAIEPDDGNIGTNAGFRGFVSNNALARRASQRSASSAHPSMPGLITNHSGSDDDAEYDGLADDERSLSDEPLLWYPSFDTVRTASVTA
jgi:hypothetical protein